MATWPAQGRPSGFMIEVLDEAAGRSGYVLDWRTIVSLERNNEALRRGDVDLVTGEVTPERRREFLVTDPWWSVGVAALVRADSAIREDFDLRGKRLAVTPGSAATAETDYPGSAIEPRASPAQSAEAVCLGDADAALMEEMFLRAVLLSRPPPCRGLDLRTVDTGAHLDFALIYRKNTATAARALKSALDDLTADGTLAAIAARHAQASAPYAVQLGESVRLRFARRTWVMGMAAALALALLGGGLALKLSHSRRSLRDANRRLKVDLDARVKAEAALRNSEASFRALFNSAPQSVFAIDHQGAIAFANRKSEDMFGQAPERLMGRSLEVLLPARLHAAFRRDRLQGVGEVFGLRAGGEEFPIEVVLGSVGTSEGLTLAFVSDISERVALQRQLLQSQKLESVGHLAGGVAHDFNNLLTVIRGYAQMALARPHFSEELREPLSEIVRAADRAASLTRQLLMFSRRQAGAPRTISLNELLGNLERMLRRLIGEDIELLFLLSPQAAAVRADPAHIEQVVVNLSINARDAMPHGGRLIIENRRRPRGRALRPQPPGSAGRRLCGVESHRYGVGHDPGSENAHLRAVLHHQAAGQGNRLGPLDGLRHCQAEWRDDLRLQRAWPGHDIQDPVPRRRSGVAGSAGRRDSLDAFRQRDNPGCGGRAGRPQVHPGRAAIGGLSGAGGRGRRQRQPNRRLRERPHSPSPHRSGNAGNGRRRSGRELRQVASRGPDSAHVGLQRPRARVCSGQRHD